MFTVFVGAFLASQCYLRLSWILDNGSAIHICNNTIASRFIKERDCTDGLTFIAGIQAEPITAYSTIDIWVETLSGLKAIILTNVYYVPTFITNLVSYSILEDKGGLYIDSENRRLYKRGVTFIFFKRYRGYYLLKDNTTDLPISMSVASPAVFASDQSPESIENNAAPPAVFPAKSATAYEWHQLMAHAYNKAI